MRSLDLAVRFCYMSEGTTRDEFENSRPHHCDVVK